MHRLFAADAQSIPSYSRRRHTVIGRSLRDIPRIISKVTGFDVVVPAGFRKIPVVGNLFSRIPLPIINGYLFRVRVPVKRCRIPKIGVRRIEEKRRLDLGVCLKAKKQEQNGVDSFFHIY